MINGWPVGTPLGRISMNASQSVDGARLVAITSIATGMRVGEVLGMQPRDINSQKQQISIERSWGRGHEKPTKTEDSKRVIQAPGVATELVPVWPGQSRDRVHLWPLRLSWPATG